MLSAAMRRFFHLIGWLLLSLLLSIMLEWIGLVWWWPDEGLQHSVDMYAAEIEYLSGDYQKSLVTDDPAAYAATITETEYKWLWEKTHGIKLVRWMSEPPCCRCTRSARCAGRGIRI